MLAGLGTRLPLACASETSGTHSGLIPDPDGTLDLLNGFSYRVLQRAGAPMDDGYRVPGRPDAMACFALPDGTLALMRNHELSGETASGPYRPGQAPPAEAYDPRGPGGVTRLVLDQESGRPLSSNLVLAGTELNCAGGVGPWGFFSCEETVSEGHGYVFLCDPAASRVQPARRLPSYGRFRHEAALADPNTHIAYLTEDEMDGAFYRFVPATKDRPFEGQLQALRLRAEARADTAGFASGVTHAVDWVDVPTTDTGDSPEGIPLRHAARELGAARIVRGEGMWRDGDQLYFTATQGGPAGRGQIFALGLRDDQLRVVVASSDPGELDLPDNLTVGPTGNLFVAEDGPNGNRLMVCTPDGQVFTLGRNARSPSEFAGVCFSPDGRRLFVNLQEDGLTLVIEGPFDRLEPARIAAGGDRGSMEDALPAPGVIGLAGSVAALGLAALARRRRHHPR